MLKKKIISVYGSNHLPIVSVYAASWSVTMTYQSIKNKIQLSVYGISQVYISYILGLNKYTSGIYQAYLRFRHFYSTYQAYLFIRYIYMVYLRLIIGISYVYLLHISYIFH